MSAGASGTAPEVIRGPRLNPRARSARAPVAQWIERCPPEAEVAGSNPAGRADPCAVGPPGGRISEAILPTGRYAALGQDGARRARRSPGLDVVHLEVPGRPLGPEAALLLEGEAVLAELGS